MFGFDAFLAPTSNERNAAVVHAAGGQAPPRLEKRLRRRQMVREGSQIAGEEIEKVRRLGGARTGHFLAKPQYEMRDSAKVMFSFV